MNRPVRAALSWLVLFRELIRARLASTTGSLCPPTIALSMARPETPRMSVATEDSLIPASSRTFSSQLISRPRSRVRFTRVRVRSRNCRIGWGGMNEPRTSPCAPGSASH